MCSQRRNGKDHLHGLFVGNVKSNGNDVEKGGGGWKRMYTAVIFRSALDDSPECFLGLFWAYIHGQMSIRISRTHTYGRV